MATGGGTPNIPSSGSSSSFEAVQPENVNEPIVTVPAVNQPLGDGDEVEVPAITGAVNPGTVANLAGRAQGLFAGGDENIDQTATNLDAIADRNLRRDTRRVAGNRRGNATHSSEVDNTSDGNHGRIRVTAAIRLREMRERQTELETRLLAQQERHELQLREFLANMNQGIQTRLMEQTTQRNVRNEQQLAQNQDQTVKRVLRLLYGIVAIALIVLFVGFYYGGRGETMVSLNGNEDLIAVLSRNIAMENDRLYKLKLEQIEERSKQADQNYNELKEQLQLIIESNKEKDDDEIKDQIEFLKKEVENLGPKLIDIVSVQITDEIEKNTQDEIQKSIDSAKEGFETISQQILETADKLGVSSQEEILAGKKVDEKLILIKDNVIKNTRLLEDVEIFGNEALNQMHGKISSLKDAIDDFNFDINQNFKEEMGDTQEILREENKTLIDISNKIDKMIVFLEELKINCNISQKDDVTEGKFFFENETYVFESRASYMATSYDLCIKEKHPFMTKKLLEIAGVYTCMDHNVNTLEKEELVSKILYQLICVDNQLNITGSFLNIYRDPKGFMNIKFSDNCSQISFDIMEILTRYTTYVVDKTIGFIELISEETIALKLKFESYKIGYCTFFSIILFLLALTFKIHLPAFLLPVSLFLYLYLNEVYNLATRENIYAGNFRILLVLFLMCFLAIIFNILKMLYMNFYMRRAIYEIFLSNFDGKHRFAANTIFVVFQVMLLCLSVFFFLSINQFINIVNNFVVVQILLPNFLLPVFVSVTCVTLMLVHYLFGLFRRPFIFCTLFSFLIIFTNLLVMTTLTMGFDLICEYLYFMLNIFIIFIVIVFAQYLTQYLCDIVFSLAKQLNFALSWRELFFCLNVSMKSDFLHLINICRSFLVLMIMGPFFCLLVRQSYLVYIMMVVLLLVATIVAIYIKYFIPTEIVTTKTKTKLGEMENKAFTIRLMLSGASIQERDMHINEYIKQLYATQYNLVQLKNNLKNNTVLATNNLRLGVQKLKSSVEMAYLNCNKAIDVANKEIELKVLDSNKRREVELDLKRLDGRQQAYIRQLDVIYKMLSSVEASGTQWVRLQNHDALLAAITTVLDNGANITQAVNALPVKQPSVEQIKMTTTGAVPGMMNVPLAGGNLVLEHATVSTEQNVPGPRPPREQVPHQPVQINMPGRPDIEYPDPIGIDGIERYQFEDIQPVEFDEIDFEDFILRNHRPTERRQFLHKLVYAPTPELACEEAAKSFGEAFNGCVSLFNDNQQPGDWQYREENVPSVTEGEKSVFRDSWIGSSLSGVSNYILETIKSFYDNLFTICCGGVDNFSMEVYTLANNSGAFVDWTFTDIQNYMSGVAYENQNLSAPIILSKVRDALNFNSLDNKVTNKWSDIVRVYDNLIAERSAEAEGEISPTQYMIPLFDVLNMVGADFNKDLPRGFLLVQHGNVVALCRKKVYNKYLKNDYEALIKVNKTEVHLSHNSDKQYFWQGHIASNACDGVCQPVMICTFKIGFASTSSSFPLIIAAPGDLANQKIMLNEEELTRRLLKNRNATAVPAGSVFKILKNGRQIGNGSVFNVGGKTKLVTASHVIAHRNDGNSCFDGMFLNSSTNDKYTDVEKKQLCGGDYITYKNVFYPREIFVRSSVGKTYTAKVETFLGESVILNFTKGNFIHSNVVIPSDEITPICMVTYEIATDNDMLSIVNVTKQANDFFYDNKKGYSGAPLFNGKTLAGVHLAGTKYGTGIAFAKIIFDGQHFIEKLYKGPNMFNQSSTETTIDESDFDEWETDRNKIYWSKKGDNFQVFCGGKTSIMDKQNFVKKIQELINSEEQYAIYWHDGVIFHPMTDKTTMGKLLEDEGYVSGESEEMQSLMYQAISSLNTELYERLVKSIGEGEVHRLMSRELPELREMLNDINADLVAFNDKKQQLINVENDLRTSSSYAKFAEKQAKEFADYDFAKMTAEQVNANYAKAKKAYKEESAKIRSKIDQVRAEFKIKKENVINKYADLRLKLSNNLEQLKNQLETTKDIKSPGAKLKEKIKTDMKFALELLNKINIDENDLSVNLNRKIRRVKKQIADLTDRQNFETKSLKTDMEEEIKGLSVPLKPEIVPVQVAKPKKVEYPPIVDARKALLEVKSKLKKSNLIKTAIEAIIKENVQSDSMSELTELVQPQCLDGGTGFQTKLFVMQLLEFNMRLENLFVDFDDCLVNTIIRDFTQGVAYKFCEMVERMHGAVAQDEYLELLEASILIRAYYHALGTFREEREILEELNTQSLMLYLENQTIQTVLVNLTPKFANNDLFKKNSMAVAQPARVICRNCSEVMECDTNHIGKDIGLMGSACSLYCEMILAKKFREHISECKSDTPINPFSGTTDVLNFTCKHNNGSKALTKCGQHTTSDMPCISERSCPNKIQFVMSNRIVYISRECLLTFVLMKSKRHSYPACGREATADDIASVRNACNVVEGMNAEPYKVRNGTQNFEFDLSAFPAELRETIKKNLSSLAVCLGENQAVVYYQEMKAESVAQKEIIKQLEKKLSEVMVTLTALAAQVKQQQPVYTENHKLETDLIYFSGENVNLELTDEQASVFGVKNITPKKLLHHLNDKAYEEQRSLSDIIAREVNSQVTSALVKKVAEVKKKKGNEKKKSNGKQGFSDKKVAPEKIEQCLVNDESFLEME